MPTRLLLVLLSLTLLATSLSASSVSQPIGWPEFVPEHRRTALLADPQLPAKLVAVENLRQARFAEPRHPYSAMLRNMDSYLAQLQPDGSFADLAPERMIADLTARRVAHPEECYIEFMLEYASQRLAAWARMTAYGKYRGDPSMAKRLFHSAQHYFTLELERPRTRWSWCTSAMVAPAAGAELYLCFLDIMDGVENGTVTDPLGVSVNDLCRRLAPRCFSEQPRGDAPDPLSIARFRHSGAWTGGNFGYRPLLDAALVCRNPAMIELVVEVCTKALSVTSWNTRQSAFWQEGMTADGSGWGHGVQGYVWGYPMDGISAVLNQLCRLQGSLFLEHLSIDALMLAANYAEGTAWYRFDPAGYTLMAPGRIALRYGPFATGKHSTHLNQLLRKLLPTEATAERARLQQRIDRDAGTLPEVTGCRYFWNNDDLIQRRHNSYVGINMTSARSASTEVVHTSSSHTEFFGAGVTFIMTRPDHFDAAKGFWDFSALPGTTVRQCRLTADYENWRGFAGLHPFAGGLSDGLLGLCSFHYEIAPAPRLEHLDIYGTRARKSYFLFENEMVCLGAGIADDRRTSPVRTCINQTEARATRLPDGTPAALPVDLTLTLGQQPLAAWNDGIGYLVLPGVTRGSVSISVEERQARWLDIHANANRDIPDKPERLPLFQMLIDHGCDPAGTGNDAYGYIVLLDCKDWPALDHYRQNLPVSILANNSDMQAVWSRQHNTVQAVFHTPGSLITPIGTLTVDAPTLLMLKDTGNALEISAADPTQTSGLVLTMRLSVSLQGPGCTADGSGTRIRLPLPEDPYCGQATHTLLQK